MKIDICPPNKKPKHKRFPNWLVLNDFTAWFLARNMKKHTKEKTLTAKQLRLLFRAVRKEAKRLNGSWEFADLITRHDIHITIRI